MILIGLQESILSNGVRIPRLGLGTWFIKNGDAEKAVHDAVRIGYRHFDTAQAYLNECSIGKAIRSCPIPRTELFITSKIAAEHKNYQAAADSIDNSLRETGLDYLDLMLIHSPQPWSEVNRTENRYPAENLEVWHALENAYRAGKVRAIGVSNFNETDIENIIANADIMPMVDQVLCHISNTPSELIAYCQNNGIAVEAYSPLGHGVIFNQKAIIETAEKYHVSVARLCIRYTLQLGLIALPKASDPEHMTDNGDVDFEISDADIEFLKNAEKIQDYGEFGRFPVFGGRK